jgi:hypothetical protein
MSEKSKEEIIWKYIYISACVIVPLIIGRAIYQTFFNVPQEEQQKVEIQYQDFDSTVWIPKKVKYKNIEKYTNYTVYMLGFEDGTAANVTWTDYMDLKVGDSTNLGDTRKFRRQLN